MTPTSQALRPLALVLLPLVLSGCGFGTAGVVSGTRGGGGSSDAPALVGLELLEGDDPDRAMLQVDVVDRDSPQVQVHLLYVDPSGGEREMRLGRGGAFPNPFLADVGVHNEVPWNFGAEDGIDGHTFQTVEVIARLGGGTEEIRMLGVGNNPTEIVLDPEDRLQGSPAVAGIVAVEYDLFDSSGDVVDVLVEYRKGPEDPWKPVREAPLGKGDAPRIPTLEGILAPSRKEGGRRSTFSWNTAADLEATDADVELRFTADDHRLGSPLEAGLLLRVNNNTEPLIDLDEASFLVNDDDLRGVPVRYAVLDEEHDRLQTCFQWGRGPLDFPELPATPELMRAKMADPGAHDELHLCQPFLHEDRGRVAPPPGLSEPGATSVRLPELGAEGAVVLGRRDLAGTELELLRPSAVPSPASAWWSRGNPLDRPVAALPLGDGLHALVLEGGATWHLSEIELATGQELRELATGPGTPTALALGQAGEALVASEVGGSWEVVRVLLAEGLLPEERVLPAASLDDGGPAGSVRGLVALGPTVAVASVVGSGDALLRLDWGGSAARVGAVVAGAALDEPWGVAGDPSLAASVLVAERGRDRIVRVDLRAGTVQPLAQDGELPSPTALALQTDGLHALVLCTDPTSGTRELRLLPLGGLQGAGVAVLATLPDDASSVATGPDRLVVVALPESRDLSVGGGLEQKRVVSAYDGATQTATVQVAFDPPLVPGQPWRLRTDPFLTAREGGDLPFGNVGQFVWDMRPFAGRRVYLRASVMDAELGLVVGSRVTKQVATGFAPPLLVGGPATTVAPVDVVAADVDLDGDQDLVAANPGGPNLTIHLQEDDGTFGGAPLVLSGADGTYDPQAVVAADLDGDGDVDLVSADGRAGTVSVFHREGAGYGPAIPLGGQGTTGRRFDVLDHDVVDVVLADLDRDGDLDVVAADSEAGHLAVFLQPDRDPQGDPGGGFAPTLDPDLVVGEGALVSPFSLIAADLNGDGLLDLAAADFGASALVVFRGTSLAPLGFAAAPVRLSSAGTLNPRDVIAIDLDEDGRLDLLTAGSTSGTLAGFLQPAGGFVEASDHDLVLGGPRITSFPFGIAAADLNADGHVDLVSANGFGNDLAIFHQLPRAVAGPSGPFDPVPVVLADPLSTLGPAAVRAADLNGDGRPDLVCASRSSNGLAVLLQTERGRPRSEPTIVGGPQTTFEPSDVAAADMNGDGLLDLLSANAVSKDVTIHYQTSSTAFDPVPEVVGGPGVLDRPSAVRPLDVDGDGLMDLVVASEKGDDLRVFRQDPEADPGFPQVALLSDPLHLVRPMGLAAADVDGDGQVDVASANFGSSTITLFLRRPNGTFEGQPVVLGSLDETDRPASVVLADLDRDGRLDVVCANSGGDTVAAFLQPSGGFVDAAAPDLVLGNTALTNGVSVVEVVDVEVDGLPDVVTGTPLFGSAQVTIWYQGRDWTLELGALTSSPLQLGGVDTGSDHGSMVTGDLDGDGDLDVLVVGLNGGESRLSVFRQTSRTFRTPALVLGTGSTLDELLATDLDADGDLDVVVTDRTARHLRVYWGGRGDGGR